MEINIKADVAETLRELSHKKRQVIQAAVRSLNRTADQVRTAAVKSVAGEMGIKSKTVRERLRVIRAKRDTLTAIVVGTGRQIGLVDFRARQTPAGVTVSVGGKRKLYKGAFLTTMPGGHRGVFRRRTKNRLPIREMWGPSIPGTMAQDHIYNALEKLAAVRWRVNFAADLKYYLNRK